MFRAAPALALTLASLPSCAAKAEEAAAGSPVTLSVLYTADIWTNARGGIRRGTAYLDNLDIALAYDADRGLGLHDTRLLISGLHNNKATFSDAIVGDLQAVSNIDTAGGTRLYEAWIEHGEGPATIKLGLMDLNSEFDVNETGAVFLNGSQGIGPEISQVGANGPGVFPITALGGRLALRRGRFEAKAGLFEGTPGDPANPRQTSLTLSKGEGSFAIGEFAFRPGEGSRVAFGGWRHSGSPAFDLAEAYGGYAMVEAILQRDRQHRVSAFLRVGHAWGGAYPLSSYQGAGLVRSGPLLVGSEEQVGLAIASAKNDGAFRAAQAAIGQPVKSRETVIELAYRTRLAPWLAIQPDIQYIRQPETDPALRDALAFGLRFEIGWSTGS